MSHILNSLTRPQYFVRSLHVEDGEDESTDPWDDAGWAASEKRGKTVLELVNETSNYLGGRSLGMKFGGFEMKLSR